MAGEMRQEWTWRDIFRSIGLAFSFSRLTIGFLGLAFFAVADGLISWGLAAVTDAGGGAWAVNSIIAARWIVTGYTFLFTATAIAYSAKGELLEGEGAGVGESIAFVFKKFGAIFWTPVLFWVFAGVMALFAFLFFVLPHVIARLFDWVPLVSLCWWAFWSWFIFIFAVLGTLGLLAFLFSLFLAPPIIATRQEGALDATLDSIDLMRGKGAFWAAILVLLASLVVVGPFLKSTFKLTYKGSELVLGDDFGKTVRAMPSAIMPRSGTMLPEYIAHFGVDFWPRDAGRALGRVETRHKVAGWIFGVWSLVTIGFAWSFMIGAIVSAATLTYLIVREEDEFLEPTTVEVPPAAKRPEEKKEEAKEEAKEEDKKEKVEKKEAEEKKPKKSKRKKKG